MKDIILVGFGGHGKSVLDSVEAMGGYSVVGYVDREDRGRYRSYGWLGTDEVLEEYYGKGIHHAAVCVGYMGEGAAERSCTGSCPVEGGNPGSGSVESSYVDNCFVCGSSVRYKLYGILKRIGYKLPVIIDPSAAVASDAAIGEGSFVGKGAVINAGSSIGKMCIINSGALVEHENKVGDFSHVAVHATLCGNVEVGSLSFIGANATVIQGITIGNNTTIGAGSVVLTNVESDKKVYGLVNRGGVF